MTVCWSHIWHYASRLALSYFLYHSFFLKCARIYMSIVYINIETLIYFSTKVVSSGYINGNKSLPPVAFVSDFFSNRNISVLLLLYLWWKFMQYLSFGSSLEGERRNQSDKHTQDQYYWFASRFMFILMSQINFWDIKESSLYSIGR